MLIHSLQIAKRVILIVVGFTLLVGGLVMSVPLVPGPGLLLVVGALVILATEFVWARRLLERVKEQGSWLRDRFVPCKNPNPEALMPLNDRRSKHANQT